jgi:hypothetical protein
MLNLKKNMPVDYKCTVFNIKNNYNIFVKVEKQKLLNTWLTCTNVHTCTLHRKKILKMLNLILIDNNIFNLLYQFNQINVIQFQKYTCYYVLIFF